MAEVSPAASARVRRGNARLLELADYVERRHRARPTEGYDQGRFSHDCGAPACMVGHAAVRWPRLAWDRKTLVPDYDKVCLFFAINADERADLFAVGGCNFAGANWRKAVAYVRDFVKQRGGV